MSSLVHAALSFEIVSRSLTILIEAVDALFGPFEVLAVDEFILQPAVQQRRNIPLDVENRGFQFMGHIPEVLLAELLPASFKRAISLSCGIGPGGEALADILDLLVLEFGEDPSCARRVKGRSNRSA